MLKYERKMYIRKGIAIGFAYLFLLSLNYIVSFWDASYKFYGIGLFGYNIWSIAGLVISAWLLDRMLMQTDKRLHFVSIFSGLLMSLGIVYGTYAHLLNDIFQSAGIFFLQLALTAGISFAAIPLSEEILLLFDRLQNQKGKNTEQKPHKPVYFFAVWILIFASYIPIFLGWWPGNFVYDAPFQLQEVGVCETPKPA